MSGWIIFNFVLVVLFVVSSRIDRKLSKKDKWEYWENHRKEFGFFKWNRVNYWFLFVILIWVSVLDLLIYFFGWFRKKKFMSIIIILLILFGITYVIDLKFRKKSAEWFLEHKYFQILFELNYLINLLLIFPLVGIGMCWLLSFLWSQVSL